MNNQYLLAIIFSAFITAGFAFLYSYAKKIVPKQIPWVPIIGWAVLVPVAFFINPALSFLLFFFYLLYGLFYYRKQNNKAIQQFFTDFEIYKTNDIPASVLAVLGDCKWSCASGKVYTKNNTSVAFNWWQGFTTSTTYNGKFTSTTITNYLSLSLPPGNATSAFKDKVKALADTSKASFGDKLKRIFVRSYYIPYLVKETPDGHFVIAWYILPNVKQYSAKLKWLMENA